jgi:hypothetical protein
MLFQVTLYADLIAMAITLWGAFYLFARGFSSWITLRAVIVLLLLSIFFLGAYNNLFQQVAGTASLRAVLLILGLETWYSLTFQLMSAQSRARLRWMAIATYALGASTAIALLLIPDAFIEEKGNALYVAHMRLSFPYILYGTFQLVIVIGILFNLLAEDRIGLTRQGKYFLVASFFPVFAISSGIIGLAVTPELPRIIPDVLTFSGMFLLGISVARHQTMIERRTTIQDLPLSLLTVLGLAGLYGYFALQWDIPLERLGAVVAFAVLTHSGYDLVREFLERLRMRNEGAFRRQLRQLENQSADEDELQIHLQDGLELLVDTLQAAGGLIAVRREDDFRVVASRGPVARGAQISSDIVLCEDISPLKNHQLPEITWIAPAFEGTKQIAVVGIGKSKVKIEYSTGDLDLLAEVAGKIGTFVSLSNLQPQRAEQIQHLVTEAQVKESELGAVANEMLATISSNPDAEFVKIVEDGLRHYADYIALGQSPLADWARINAGSHVERGKRLQTFLGEAMESFRPAGARPPEPLPRVWYSYVVLHDAYVEGVPNREIMARLYISEGTFNRTRRNALRALARSLIEKRAS